MEDRAAVIERISKEVNQDDAEIRNRFLGEFQQEADEFIQHMADAFLRWQTLDDAIGPDEKLGHVSAFVYSALADLMGINFQELCG